MHAFCLNPPLAELPAALDDWSCPRCTATEPTRKPEKFVTWRWRYIDYPEPVADEDRLKEGETPAAIAEADPPRHIRLMLARKRNLSRGVSASFL